MLRVGHGYDTHKFCISNKGFITVCGVKIPHSKAIKAHSDGDVGIHALVDAMLGAVACGDIGEHFSSTDDKWKDADSALFLIEANAIVSNKDFCIANIDITIICEQPKMSQYKLAMREKLAYILGLEVDVISVKAKTNEKMGFLGKGEGIAAHTTVLLVSNK